MKVHKVVKRDEPSHKKITGAKVVTITRDPASSLPFKVVVAKGGTVIARPPGFINKSAALGWIELNAKDAELRDLVGDGSVRSQLC